MHVAKHKPSSLVNLPALTYLENLSPFVASCLHILGKLISLHWSFAMPACRSSAEWQNEGNHAAGTGRQKVSLAEWKYTARGSSEASWE